MNEQAQSIAVIGMACRFPGARDVDQFWSNIADGVESITQLSEEELRAAGVPEEIFRDPDYVARSGLLEDVDRFDAGFFGLTPLEAAVLDPQHRLLLETTQAVFDHAGYAPGTLTAHTGVYVGVGFPSYLVHNLLGRPDVVERIGQQKVFYATDKGFVPTRISHEFGLTGPSIGIDTACSTSLVAVHQACRSLLAYDCDLALAGGASVAVPVGTGYMYHEGGIMSPDGRCRAFDASAAGTLFGSGVGMVLLKRLEDAVADRDRVLAVIRGSAVNNDGGGKAGFTAPSVRGQARVIAEALEFAEVSPETVGYVEAHGTGTVIGDPIEVAALTRAYRERTSKTGYCALGSVKTNFGHLDVAAGVAGLIKAVQALRHAQLPPILNWERPNPAIDFAGGPFYVNDRLRPWPASENPRRAGVSSFGIGGTNAHVLVEEAPRRTPSGPSRPAQLVVISARSRAALDRMCAELASALETGSAAIADVAYTLSIGRRAHPHRRAFVCRETADAVASLRGGRPGAVVEGRVEDEPRVAFLFPGQGAHRPGMLAGLYEHERVFRRQVDRCAQHARALLGVDLRDVIFRSNDASGDLDETWLTHPALFTISFALAELWRSWGVRPSTVAGHSLGEFTAAAVAGMFTVEDALDLVIVRARLLHESPPGGMLAVTLAEDDLVPLLGECSLAAVNDPLQCVASGSPDAIGLLADRLTALGVEHRRVRAEHGFHSSLVDGVAHELETHVAGVVMHEPEIPVVSTVTGEVLTSPDPAYWARQLRHTVRFADAVRTIAQDPRHLFLEIGPSRTLAPMVRRAGVDAARITASAGRGGTDVEVLLAALGELFRAGVPLSWPDFWSDEQRNRVTLPGYSFDRERHWIEPGGVERDGAPSSLYTPVWRPVPLEGVAPEGSGTWFVAAEDDEFERVLRQQGHAVARLRWSELTDPALPDDVDRVLDAVDHPPSHVLLDLRGDTTRDPLLVAATWVRALLARVEGDPIRLAVLCDGVVAVVPGDEPVPARATLAAFCRAVVDDHPGLAITCFDVEGAADLAAIVRENVVDSGDVVVAYREGVRHVELLAPSFARLEEGVRDRASLMITGRFSTSSESIVRELARSRRARLTLAVDEAVPEREDWPRWLDPVTGPALAGAQVARQRRSTVVVSAELDVEDVAAAPPRRPGRAEAEATLNALCCGYAYDTFVEAGIDLEPGSTLRRSDIAARVRVLPKFAKYLDFLLGVLHDEGVVRWEEDVVEVLLGPDDVGRVDAATASKRVPELAVAIDFLDHCARHLPAALSGDVDAVGVLFPDGDSARLEASFRNLLDNSDYHARAESLGRFLSQQVGARPLRILEVGAGNGQLTRVLAAALRGRAVEYWFTDLGASFVHKARRHPTGHGFGELRCQVLDISQDPVAQGFEPHYFDAVVAFDVVHATPRVDQTIGNLRRLLAPRGLLCLVETVRSLRWVEMLWGLAEGWWLFEDDEFRTTSPLMGLDSWDTVLRRQRFVDVVSFPRTHAARTATDYGLVLAQMPDDAGPEHIAVVESQAAELLERVRSLIDTAGRLEHLGAEVLLTAADPASPEQVAGVVSTVWRHFGALDGIVHIADPVEGLGADWTPAALSAAVCRYERLARSLSSARVGVTFVSGMESVCGGKGTMTAALSGACFSAFASGRRDPRTGSVHRDGDGDALVDVLGRQGVAVVSTRDPAADRVRSTDRANAVPEPTSEASVERDLLQLFRQLFGIDHVGLHDDFQRLGGDSLLATQAIARVRRKFSVDISVKALYDAPTVAGLAEKIREVRLAEAGEDRSLERVPRTGDLPLSVGQQSLWLAEQVHGPSPTYNIPGAVRLSGRLDVGALRHALDEVVQRHEVLRTTVHDNGDMPVQRVHDDMVVDLPVRDIAESQVDDLAQDHAKHVFDLSTGPLMRIALLRIDVEDHVLLVNVHHIVSDGWSLGVLVQELVTLYSAFARGAGSPLQPLAHQYADFAHWQRELLDGAMIDEQLAYWHRKLAGLPPVLELPTDRPRPPVQRIRNAVLRFTVPSGPTSRLLALSRVEGVTLFMTLLAGFKVLLGRYAGTSDVAVGTTSANRSRAAFEQMIGMFVNNLVLRTDLGGDPTFRELLERVRTTAVDAYAHQDLPFLTLVDELGTARSPAVTPLFQVLFLLQKLNITVALPGITARTVEVDALHTKFDLTLFMEEMHGELVGTFIYNAELFDRSTVDRMAGHLVQFLAAAAGAPDTPISALRMETEEEARTRTMNQVNSKTARLQSLRGSKRRSVDLFAVDPVRTGFLPEAPTMPLVVTPAVEGVDLPGWLRENQEVVDTLLHRHGAVLLRGFSGGSVTEFEAVASAVCPTLFREYGDLPKEGDSGQIYQSTPYPEDRSILFHNESSHLDSWPMRQFFSCLVPARAGGETPIVDCREVYRLMRPELRARFADRKLRYVRNFIDSVDVSWQRFYGTDERAEIERRCAEAGVGFSWAADGTLRTWRVADAVLTHPKTGESVFFNQLALHHVSCLDGDIRGSLESLYGLDGLPRNVYWGDGEPIGDDVVAEVRELMDRTSVAFTWEAGDILMIDNMLVAHSRRPFTGPRKVVVALGDVVRHADLMATEA